MKKQLLIPALFAIITIKSYSQIIFENGYFINETGQKTECLIRNVDWFNNPIDFEYKMAQDAPVQKATIQDVKEFGITGVSKYIRALVNIDRSSNELKLLDYNRNPVFHEELLFLKVLVEGKASLFLYKDGDITKFFYKTTDSEIMQLVYKCYLFDDIVATNNYFRQQLFVDLKCKSISLNDVDDIKYVRGDLVRVFLKYNECENSGFINYESVQKKDLFNLSVRPGINYSRLALSNSLDDFWDFDFGGKFCFRFGVETEFILPVNKNKWSIIIEPTYQNFRLKKEIETITVTGGGFISKINYQSVEVPIGIRHSFFFNEDSKVFANISYLFDISFKSYVEYSRTDNYVLKHMDIKPERNIVLGIGYEYKSRYSIEMRYQTGRQLLHNRKSWDANYKTLSLILGYSLF